MFLMRIGSFIVKKLKKKQKYDVTDLFIRLFFSCSWNNSAVITNGLVSATLCGSELM